MRFLATAWLISTLCFAQQRNVPFVGCAADGQAGPVDAPANGTISLAISQNAARQLAYYSSYNSTENRGGILAPRGWNCLFTYGSSGSILFVSPNKVTWPPGPFPKFSAPVVALSETSGEGSGSGPVAEIVGRVFPRFQNYARAVARGWGIDIQYSPYPGDRLKRKSDRVVEYRTSPRETGLGTQQPLVKSDLATSGVVIVEGDITHLIHLQVRLPRGMEALAAEIISQAEREPDGH